MRSAVAESRMNRWRTRQFALSDTVGRPSITAFVCLLAIAVAYVLFAPIPSPNVMAAATVAGCGWVGLMVLWASLVLLWVAGPFFVGMPLLQLTIDRYSDYHIGPVPDSFALASLAVLFYLVTFATGTAVGRSMTVRGAERERAISYRRAGRIVKLFLVSGCAGWILYFHAMGGVHYFLENLQNRTQLASGLGYVFLLATLLQVGTLIAAAFAAAKQPVLPRPILITLVVASVALVLLAGMRSRAIMFVAMIAIAAHALGRRVPRSQWIALGVLGVVAMIVVGQVRELGSGTGAILSSKEVKSIVRADSIRLVQQAIVDYGHFDRLSLIQEYVPARVAFQHGHTFFSTLAAPVPRLVWREKPVGAGPLLANAFRPGAWDLEEGWASGVTPTIIGELFLNFSWVGIVVGGLVVGVIAGWAHGKFERNRKSIWAVLSYTVFAVLFLASGTLGEFYGTVLMYTVYAVPIGLAAVYSRSSDRR